MPTRLAAVLTALLVGTTFAQNSAYVTTRALEPAADDLTRLNLVTAWRLYLPVASRADGIATVQPFEGQVYVQLTSGTVVAIQSTEDPKTFRKAGDVLWTYRPAQAPGVVRPLAVGSTEVYIVQGQKLILLDRTDGKMKYTEEMTSTAQAAPAVDSAAVYIPLSNRHIVAYSHEQKIPGYRPTTPVESPDPITRITLTAQTSGALSSPNNRSPSIGMLETVRPPFYRSLETIDHSPSVGNLKTLRPPYREVDATRSPSVGLLPNLRSVHELTNKIGPTRIMYLWDLLAPGLLRDTPVLTVDPADPSNDRITSSTGRSIFTAGREAPRTNNISTEYTTEADVSAQLTNYGDILYAATADSNMLALSMRELREPSLAANTLPRGKFTTGGPVIQKPLLTDDSLYVVGERWGLIRLQQGTLEPMWKERLADGRVRARANEEVVRILSVNSAYVYAADRLGRLLVIDANRGSTLSMFDMSQFSVPVMNDVNDRVYLAANSGLLVCLHDRQRVKPEWNIKPVAPPKKVDVEAKPEVEPKKDAAPKKEPEKKEPEKKEPADKK